MKRRALFLDRDGVVCHLAYYPSHREWEAARHVRDLSFIDGAVEAMRKADAAGWLLFLITNQPSYAKGKCPLEDLQEVHAAVLNHLHESSVPVTASFVCYHHPESQIEGFGPCDCRKPRPDSLLRAADEYELNLAESWIAGDQDTDIQTGRAAGCRTALITYPASEPKRGRVKPDIVCSDLDDFISRLEGIEL